MTHTKADNKELFRLAQIQREKAQSVLRSQAESGKARSSSEGPDSKSLKTPNKSFESEG